MYEVFKKVSFDAAHLLAGHTDPVTGEAGKCSRLHGHTYTIGVSILSHELSPIGVSCDYGLLGVWLKELANRWDHRFIENPSPSSAELIAREVAIYIYPRLQQAIQEGKIPPCQLLFAECSETPNTWARFYVPYEAPREQRRPEQVPVPEQVSVLTDASISVPQSADADWVQEGEEI